MVKKKTKRDLLLETNRWLQETTQKLFIVKQELEKKNKELQIAKEREQHQKEELQRELKALKHLAGPRLQRRAFQKDLLIKSYSEVIKKYITQKNASPAEIAQKTAEKFFKKALSGKDVIDIHLSAMDILTKDLQEDMARPVVERARFLVVGILVNLTDLYRG